MPRRIPPLNPLHVFEAAARLGNFTRAAEELHVTQSAVSRQISTLEGYLGVPLFERNRSGVALTPVGRSFQAEIGPAFTMIASATEKIVSASLGNQVRVRTYTTFVAKWLMRRLPAFHAEYPHIEVKLSTATQPVDFSRDQVDVAIQVGTAPFPSARADWLFADEIEPVCSPALLQAQPIREVADLARHRLLHSHYRRDDWGHWLRHAGRPDLIGSGRGSDMTFSSSVLTYQAAMEGMGVAMGQVHLLEAEFETGQLVRPLQQPLLRTSAYHVLVNADRHLPASALAFHGWLLRQALRLQPELSNA